MRSQFIATIRHAHSSRYNSLATHWCDTLSICLADSTSLRTKIFAVTLSSKQTRSFRCGDVSSFPSNDCYITKLYTSPASVTGSNMAVPTKLSRLYYLELWSCAFSSHLTILTYLWQGDLERMKSSWNVGPLDSAMWLAELALTSQVGQSHRWIEWSDISATLPPLTVSLLEDIELRLLLNCQLVG